MADEVARRGVRWLVETVKALASMAVGAAMVAAVSCAGISDALGGLGFSEDNPQPAPNADVTALHELTVRLETVVDGDLACAARYLVKEKELDLLAGAMARQQTQCTADTKELVAAVNDAETRADEAEARAELAEADLAKIRSLLQPAAADDEGGAAEGASE